MPKFSRKPTEPGYFLEASLLDHDRERSQGAYGVQFWAVRLGCAPDSREANAAKLLASVEQLL